MNELIILHIILYIFLIEVHGEAKTKQQSKNPLPLFRQQVEEVEEPMFEFEGDNDDQRSHLMSILVNNVKEIFTDLMEKTDTTRVEEPTRTGKAVTHVVDMTRPTIADVETSHYTNQSTTNEVANGTEIYFASPPPLTSTDATLYENSTISSVLDKKQAMTESTGIMSKPELKNDIKYVGTDEKEQGVPDRRFGGNSTELEAGDRDPRRSCIMCNNVVAEDCNDPRNRLIQSVVCARDDDMCYSMHTPFGIIDRGCFNANHNLTTYVCSCNLCNFMSISEMPYTFANKHDWVDNVIELSRTRGFRKSVFRDMSCLRCEVNTTQQKGDVLDGANCLEGNIGSLPVEECDQNEVCAVKALRADGYIWRGCLKAPLYNYWWSMCNYDLCNYDTIISLYDYV
ncbi:uncharacterized protein LOC142976284 [Anticarsia gemmatalis]|uniref:uncharacterized protein LOC142976284 n=1 Tax=Anticarsia gemmatalis TaxID=129554 RepID=UPI003F764352